MFYPQWDDEYQKAVELIKERKGIFAFEEITASDTECYYSLRYLIKTPDIEGDHKGIALHLSYDSSIISQQKKPVTQKEIIVVQGLTESYYSYNLKLIYFATTDSITQFRISDFESQLLMSNYNKRTYDSL